jgi:hypothetical protein
VSLPINDNLEPTTLRIASFVEAPNDVCIAISRSDAILCYWAGQNEALDIALDIMDRALPPPPQLTIIEADLDGLPEPQPPPRYRQPTPDEEKEWIETGRITGVVGWTTSATAVNGLRKHRS